jgi:hypothetical protein
MPTWLTRITIGCATTIISFVAMILLFILTLYLECGACEPEYNSPASDYFLLIGFAPIFLLASIILGTVVGYLVKLRAKIQNGPLPKS